MMKANCKIGKNRSSTAIIMGLMIVLMMSINSPSAMSSSAVSASGTTIPLATQIVDSQNNTWTLSSTNTVIKNGSPAGYTSNVVLILYYNSVIYQKNSAGAWWSWAGVTWAASSDPRLGISGVCGSANGVVFSSAPTINLCSSGVSTAVSGSGPWNWSCNGTSGGSDAFCSAGLSLSVASVNGTTIPPATQILDSQNNTWTLSASNAVLKNGISAGYTNNVVSILYYNGVIYQKNSAGSWWSWTGGSWISSSDPRPSISGACGSANGKTLSSVPITNLCSSGNSTTVSGSGPWNWSCNGTSGGSNASCSVLLLQNVNVSANGTTIPPASQIVDSQNNAWTLSASKTILKNASPAGYSNNVVLILYYNGVVYQENSAGSWWSWAGGSWTNSSDPRTSGSGVCGIAKGVAVSNAPATDLCANGSASTVTNNGTLWNWTCNASNGGSNASCSAPFQPAAINGTCGISNGAAVSKAPSANLCGSGISTSVSGSGPWTWNCDGTNGGSDVSCSATLLTSVISSSGTTIPSAMQIVDSQNNIWTLSSSSTVMMNASAAGYTNNVVLILYYNGVIYQKNATGNWWSWTGGIWVDSSDPRSGICGTANGTAVSSAPTTNLCNSGVTTAVSGSGPWSWGCVGSNGSSAQCSAPSTATLNNLFGVNLASAEFGQNFPGKFGLDYSYPTASELDYYKSKGLTLIRIPFAWERMQPTLNGPLDSAQVGYMTNFLNAADARGMSVIMDVHNYGRYGIGSFSDFTTHGNIIGSSQVPVSAFANLWSQLAGQFQGHSSLLGYDIMNEPHDMGGPSVWPIAAQAAVNAIRAVDTKHMIFVEGDGWATAANWASNNANLNINDPSGHLVYEAHQYFDADNSGTYTSSYDAEGAYPTVGVDRLQPFATWLTQHGFKGWVGENGIPNNDPRWLTVLNNFLTALKNDGIWGTYWAGGPWWGNYTLSCEPASGQDSVQMTILEKYPSA